MLKQRVIAALCMIPIVLCCLFLLPPSIFSGVMILLCMVAAWEWAQFISIFNQKGRVIYAVVVGVILTVLLFSVNQFSLLGTDLFTQQTFIQIVMWVALVWWCCALVLVIGYPKSARMWAQSKVLGIIFCLVTLVPFFFSMLALRYYHFEGHYFIGGWYLLFVMILVWAADTGAYTFGRLFGKHKLAPSVSPGKTIEGFVGGLISAVVIGVILNLIFPLPFKFIPLVVCSVVAILVSVLGDLTESMFKREAKIKDSSQLIPGHGGILDRIDSLTAAIPVFVCLIFYLF